jgi:predicted DCC family thiol-disulfide oxidoreductase YuxK
MTLSHAPKMASPVLPDPESNPNADVVIWDGQCNFCRGQVERLRRWDSDKLSYLSLHDVRARELCPDLTEEQLMEQIWVVQSDGATKFGGADAARYLSKRLPKLWWLFPVLHIPLAMPLWRWVYRQIAKRRYKISGRNCETGTCRIP